MDEGMELQVAADVDFLKSQPGWQVEDMEKRRDWLRGVAERSLAETDPAVHRTVLGRMWQELDDRGTLEKAGDFTGKALTEVVKSIPALGGAAVMAGLDAVGATDSGSGTRLKRGVADMASGTVQRVKSLHPDDWQEYRDRSLEALKKDLDEGAYPDGVDDWLTGDESALEDEETRGWVEALTTQFAKQAVRAEHGEGYTPEQLRRYLESDRNPGSLRSMAREFGPGPRTMLADYVATRDPQSWEAFRQRVSETDTQINTRLARYSAEGELRAVMDQMEDGSLMKDLMQRSAEMQGSPIDLAMSLVPFLKGARALRAARAGSRGRAVLEAGKAMALEGGTEALTEAVMDPNAPTSQIVEAGGMGAVGGGVVGATGAGLGMALRKAQGGDAGTTVEPDAGAGETQAYEKTTTVPEQPEGAAVAGGAPAGLAEVAMRAGRVATEPPPVMTTEEELAALEDKPERSPEEDERYRALLGEALAREEEAGQPPVTGKVVTASRPFFLKPLPVEMTGPVLDDEDVDPQVEAAVAALATDLGRTPEDIREKFGFEDERDYVAYARAARLLPREEQASAETERQMTPDEAVALLAQNSGMTPQWVRSFYQFTDPEDYIRAAVHRGLWTPPPETLLDPQVEAAVAALAAHLKLTPEGVREKFRFGYERDYVDYARAELLLPGEVNTEPTMPRLDPDAAMMLGGWWRRTATQPGVFSYGFAQPGATDIHEIARDMSNGMVTAKVETTPSGRVKEIVLNHPSGGWIMIEELNTRHPKIYAPGANSRGRERGGGSLMYAIAMQWAVNNGRRIMPSNQLTPVNRYVRRTSNMASSALRTGTTDHMVPDNAQGVQGWMEGDTVGNTGRLFHREMEQVMKAFPRLKDLRFDFDTGNFVDYGTNAPQPVRIDRDGLAALVEQLDPRGYGNDQGIGESTAKRAIITQSVLRALYHGERVGADPGRLHGGLETDLLYSAPQEGAPSARRVGQQDVTDALTMLRAAVPGIGKMMRVVGSQADLNPADYRPADWARMGEMEGFLNPRTGVATVLRNQVRVRPGETPARAVARVVLHERLGHYGLRAAMTTNPAAQARWNDLVGELETVYGDELAAIGQEPGYTHLQGDPMRLAEEWFARRVEEMTPEQLETLAPTSLLGRMWQWLKDVVKGWFGPKFSRKEATERELREVMALAKRAVREGPALGPDAAVDEALLASAWNPLTTAFYHRPGTAFKVKAQRAMGILTGSTLPAEFRPAQTAANNARQAVNQTAAMIGRDLDKTIGDYAKRTGIAPVDVYTTVNQAMEDPVALAGITDRGLQAATARARNFLDDLSQVIAVQAGQQRGAVIMQNLGQWMRRSYAAFDPAANWSYDTLQQAAAAGRDIAGRPARQILDDAERYLRNEHPQATAGEIEAMMRDLTDRDTWAKALGGEEDRVSKNVSSLMHRRDLPPELRALMGEETNPIKRLVNSASFQSQFIARHEMQKALRGIGLQAGLFSTTREGMYNTRVGGEDAMNRWSGFGELYTTPALMAALRDTRGVMTGTDLGSLFVSWLKWFAGEGKLNKVALSMDSWAPNIEGALQGVVASGDVFSPQGWKNIFEAMNLLKAGRVRLGDVIGTVQGVYQDAAREMLGRLRAAGVTSGGLEMQDIEANLDNRVLQMLERSSVADRTAGAARGAIVGQSLGSVGGLAGRSIGAVAGAVAGGLAGNAAIVRVQKRIAEMVMGAPDNWGKIVVYLGNYQAHLAAGMNPDAAHELAAEKAMNTMPDYSKLHPLFRELSRLGPVGTFIAFQHEVYRNTFQNYRYAVQEIRSGNPALVARGARRLLGVSMTLAMGRGYILPGVAGGLLASGVSEREDEAYRRALAKPWDRFSSLAYKELNKDRAVYYNTSYLIPQATIMELLKAAEEGQSFEEALENVAGALKDQFLGGSVHADPLLEAIMNVRKSGTAVSYKDGVEGMVERLDHASTVLTPGTVDKVERVLLALLGRGRGDREFSLKEELLRVVGNRQTTYQHNEAIRSRLFEFSRELRDARAAAERTWSEMGKTKTDAIGRAEQERAVAKANERIAKVAASWDQWLMDLETLGLSRQRVKNIQSIYHIAVNPKPLKLGKDGPEAQ